MVRRLLLPSIIILVQAGLAADSSRSPVLEWFKTISGTGGSVATAAAADYHGNLYITGNTSSLDFPTVAAAQPTSGGSPANRIVSIEPSDEKTSGAVQVTTSSSGVTSNPVYMPAAVASPGIYSADGSGVGQGYILNKDGSRNSQTNPAAVGSTITVFATGVGPFSEVGPFAVTDLPAAVFVDGFYANGIAAVMKQVPGLPGQVYQISVYIPDPAKLASQNPQWGWFHDAA